MQWKGDVVASPRRGGRLAPREQRCPLPPSTPQALGAPVKGTEKKRQQNNPKSAGCGWGRKEAAACGAGDPTFLSGGSAEASGGPEERKGRGAGGKGPLAPPRPLASRGGRWCGGGMAGGGGRPCSPPRGLLGMAAVVVAVAVAAGWGALVGGTKRPAAVGPPQAWFSSGGCCGARWYRGMGAALLGEGAVLACRTDLRRLIKAVRWWWGEQRHFNPSALLQAGSGQAGLSWSAIEAQKSLSSQEEC